MPAKEKMYSCKKKADDYFMTFSASFENVDVVCSDIQEFLENTGLDLLSFAVELGARETINNAIVHGSHQDEEKQITFRIYRQNNRLHLETVDQGTGFTVSGSGNQQSSNGAPLLESGRGLTILKQYFDTVQLSHNGRGVMLVLNIADEQ